MVNDSQRKFYISSLILLVILLTAYIEPTMAQCPMCKASAESSLREGSNMALGLNRGILYLLMMPYLLFSVLFLLWYWNYRKSKVVVS